MLLSMDCQMGANVYPEDGGIGFLCNIIYIPNCTASGSTTALYTVSFYCCSKVKDGQKDSTCQQKDTNCCCDTTVCLPFVFIT
jgi:hypothetical protein